MKNQIINNIIYRISMLNKYSATDLEKIKFGLEVTYLNATKFIVILIISLLINAYIELVLFIIAFSILKTFGFGLHAKKSWQCWVTSIIIFEVVPYLIKAYTISDEFLYILTPLFIISFLLFAPADTEKRPLINRRKRLAYKVMALVISVLYIFIIFYVKNYYLTSILFYSMLLESILINPIMYKLFGLKYKNYLSYKRKGEKNEDL